MAWLVGGFGLSNHAEGGVTFLDHAILMMERGHLGWMNWESWPGDWGPIASDKRSDSNNATALVNVYPRAVAGEINHYHFDRHINQFTLIYSKNEAQGTTEIAIPPRFAELGITISSNNPDNTWDYYFDEERYILHIEHDPKTTRHLFIINLGESTPITFKQIINVQLKKCLDYRNPLPEEGAEVITWECGEEQHSWQRWGYDPSTQRIHSMQNTELCLTHEAKSDTAIRLEACSDSPTQQWVWGEENIVRAAMDENLVLDAFDNGQENGNGDGGTVGLWEHHGNLNQQWKLGHF